MSRIDGVFEKLKSQGRKALVPYITAGDPHPRHTVALMHALVQGGADVLELGVPFSDPMADGPVIQLACERALAHGDSDKVRAAYHRGAHWNERVEMAQWWSDYLDELRARKSNA